MTDNIGQIYITDSILFYCRRRRNISCREDNGRRDGSLSRQTPRSGAAVTCTMHGMSSSPGSNWAWAVTANPLPRRRRRRSPA